MRITRRAHAKVNLDLRILSRLPDGYHELATVFQTLELHDTLHFEPTVPREPVTVACSDPDVPTDARNLAWRAAAALWAAAGRPGAPAGVAIDIVKRIPTQGGLGGGSANAAVTLVALSDLWGLDFDARALAPLGARLGADVPFFLAGGIARGGGRGDRIEAWQDGPLLEAVLAVPSFGVPTADAFRWFDEEAATPARTGLPPPPQTSWNAWLAGCRNDLEETVVRRHPAIGRARALLAAAGATPARMSGSGSTVYGLFRSGPEADRAAASLGGLDLRVLRTRTLPRAAYLRDALGRDARWLPAGSGIV